jgi:hypothetical protein
LFLFLLCFSRTEMFGAMCWEATFKNIFISLYMFEMFKSFRVSLCWDKWVLQGSQQTMCRSGSFTDRQKCWGFSLLSALWSGLFCDYQFDITTIAGGCRVFAWHFSAELSLWSFSGSLQLQFVKGQKKGFDGLSFRKERGAFAGCSLSGADRE